MTITTRPVDMNNRKHRTKPKSNRSKPTGKSNRGRRRSISDEDLALRRNTLVMLFEVKWGEFAWKLQHIKKPDDLRLCLAPLVSSEGLAGVEPAMRCLTKGDSEKASGQDVRHTQEKLLNLQKRQSSAQSMATALSEKVAEGLVALRQARSKPTPPRSSSSQRKERANELRHVRHVLRDRRRISLAQLELCVLLENDRRALQAQLENQEAHFTRTELFRFVRKKQYELNPRNLANAVAGFPILGWQQSFRRCKPLPLVSGPSIQFLVFCFLRKTLIRLAPAPHFELARGLREAKNKTRLNSKHHLQTANQQS